MTASNLGTSLEVIPCINQQGEKPMSRIITITFVFLTFLFTACGGGQLATEAPTAPAAPELSGDDALKSDGDVLLQQSPTNVGNGAYFNGQLWVFSHTFDTNSRFYYTRFKDGKKVDKHQVCSSSDCAASPYAPSPVVYKDNLYLFWVDHSGDVRYMTNAGNKWEGPHKVSGRRPDGEVSPVYNTSRGRLDVFFRKGRSLMYWSSKDGERFDVKTETWGMEIRNPPSGAVMMPDFNGGKGLFPTVAVRNTLRSIIVLEQVHLDGDTFKEKLSMKLKEKTKNRSYLVDMSFGHVALIWRGTDGRANVKYYDTENKSWYGKRTWGEEDIKFHLTGAVDFRRDGENLKAHLMVFWAQHHTWWKDELYMWREKFVGTWKRESMEQVDWAGVDGIEDHLPVVGVVNSPPPFVNGTAGNRTRLAFSHEETKSTRTSVSLKSEVYAKLDAGPISAEVTAGIIRSKSKTASFSTRVNYSLSASEPLKAMELYLAPEFEVTRYRFHTKDGKSTKRIFTVLNAKGGSILKRKVDLASMKHLPQHQANKPETYGAVDLKNARRNTVSWDSGESSSLTFASGESTVEGRGTHASIKVEAGLSEALKLGYSGSVNLSFSTTTTVRDTLTSVLDNPQADRAGDVSRMNVTMHLAAPSKDGNWVPPRRRGHGDAPWFLTYSVASVTRLEDALDGSWDLIERTMKVPARTWAEATARTVR